MTVIVTILGLGRQDKNTGDYVYEEATYQWSRFPDKPVKTRLVQQALREWFPEADILALATEEALEHTWPKVKPIGNVCFRKIPKGSSQNEFWKIYNAVTESLPYRARVILDFTHGLRSIPLITLLALVFLRSAGRIELEAVMYAAQDAKTPEGITPIFDLTPFLSMLDWASATNRFLETGDASKFRPLVEARGAKPLNPHLNSAVRDLDSLSLALSSNRVNRSGEIAFAACEKIKRAQNGEWEASHAPLKLLLPRLEQGLGMVALDVIASQRDQLVQSFGQVNWFLNHRQYEKALGLAREWMVSFVQWKREGSWLPVEFSKRKEAENWLGQFSEDETPTPEGWADFIGLWRNLGHLRNDLLHFGFRDAARKESAIPDEVTERIRLLRAAVLPLGLELPENPS